MVSQKSLLLLIASKLVFFSSADALTVSAPPIFLNLGVISGSLEAKEAKLPEHLDLEVRTSSGISRNDSIEAIELACSVAGNRFVCPVPAGAMDARLLSSGFAPVYFWGLRVESLGTVEVGKAILRTGASLSGWVVVEDGSVPPSEVTLELRPEVIGWQGNPAERKRIELRHHRGTVGRNGFFQLTGLDPGEYVLSAQRTGFSPATAQLTIPVGGETALREPLRLESLTSLKVWLSPSTNLDGTPWQIELYTLVPKTNVYKKVTRSAAALDGSWVSGPLQTGLYEVVIQDLAGSNLYRGAHQVDSSTPPLSLDLDLVPVRGILSAGDKPFAGTVVFGTTNRHPNVRLDADGEGRFEGYLPRDGVWPIEVLLSGDRKLRAEDVEVERLASGEPDVIEVNLAETRIAGRVVARGAPVGDAFVVITREADGKPRREAAMRVDRDGRFEALGLSPGPLSVRAYDRTRTSKWEKVQLDDGTDISGLQLELGDEMTVQGRLYSSSGPAAGGLVVAWADLAGTKPLWLGETVSAADGSFELSVDARSQALKIVVAVPGCGVEIGRFPVPAEPGKILTVTCAPGKGEILLEGTGPEGLLFHAGADIEANTLFGILDRAGLAGWSEQGLVLRAMPQGHYRLCITGNCGDGELAPGSQLILSPRKPAEPGR